MARGHHTGPKLRTLLRLPDLAIFSSLSSHLMTAWQAETEVRLAWAWNLKIRFGAVFGIF